MKESLRCEIHESLLRMEVRPEEREKKLFQSGSLGDCFHKEVDAGNSVDRVQRDCQA